jgi:hypothetical protein
MTLHDRNVLFQLIIKSADEGFWPQDSAGNVSAKDNVPIPALIGTDNEFD